MLSAGCNTLRTTVPSVPEYYLRVTWLDDARTIPKYNPDGTLAMVCLEDLPDDDGPATILPPEKCDGVTGAKGKDYLLMFNFFSMVLRHVDQCLNNNKKCITEIEQIPHAKIKDADGN